MHDQESSQQIQQQQEQENEEAATTAAARFTIYENAYQYCRDHPITILVLNADVTAAGTATSHAVAIAVDDNDDTDDTFQETVEEMFHGNDVNDSPRSTLIHIVDEWDGTYHNHYCNNKQRKRNNTIVSKQKNNQLLLHQHVPCLIRNCTILQQECFAIIQQNWIVPDEEEEQYAVDKADVINNHNNTSNSTKTIKQSNINREWFLRYCNEAIVPVYDQSPLIKLQQNDVRIDTDETSDDDDVGIYNQSSTSYLFGDSNLLDKDGRAIIAVDCGSVPRYVTMHHYISNLLLQSNEENGNDTSFTSKQQLQQQVTTADTIPYCKDWHFQFWYEQQQRILHQKTNEATDDGNNSNHASCCNSHRACTNDYIKYTLPEMLPYDLLNGFLLRFDPSSPSCMKYCKDSHLDQDRVESNNNHIINHPNDYRFLYWGPSNTYTNIHTDVLLSLSWSYNVYGCKLWTFYIPAPSSSMVGHELRQVGDDEEIVISIKQRSGELIIVPSNIKHTVVNIQETLSINHNWIIADILYNVWDCIKVEAIAVDNELKTWQSSWSVVCCGAREKMLRHCVGLNVSQFFFMILTRGLDLLQEVVVSPNAAYFTNSTQLHHQTKNHRNDLIHISNVLHNICNDPTIQIKERLVATLRNNCPSTNILSSALTASLAAEESIRIATKFIQYISTNKTVRLYSV